MIRARPEQGLEPVWFVLPGQEGEAEPARFLLRPLTSPQIVEVEQEISRAEDGGYKMTARGYELLWRYGVEKIEGCENHDGTPLTRVADALAWLPEEIILLVGLRVFNNSRLQSHEKKASPARSQSPRTRDGSPDAANAARAAAGAD